VVLEDMKKTEKILVKDAVKNYDSKKVVKMINKKMTNDKKQDIMKQVKDSFKPDEKDIIEKLKEEKGMD